MAAPAAGPTKTASAQTVWSVNRVASLSVGSYCTIAQKFDNNSVLTLARNVKGEYSLAVDFSSPMLKDGTSQTLKLQAGTAKAESFQITPKSQQIAVLPLGKDSQFIKNLQNSSSLKISVADHAVGYQLKKFKEGHDNLVNCVTALGDIAKPPENKGNQSVIGSAKPDSKAEQAAIDPVKNDAKSPDRIAAQEVSVEGLLAAKPTPSEQSLRSSQSEQSQALASASKVTKEKLAAIEPAAHESMPAQSAKKAEILSSSTTGAPTSSGLSSEKIKSLESQNEDLRSKLSELQATQVKMQDADQGKYKGQIRDLTAQIERLQSEKKDLQAGFEKLQKDNEAKQLKQVGGNWDLEQATKRYQESQREIRRLGARIEEEQLKCEAEKKQVESMLFDPEITQTSQISKLNSLKDQLQEKETKISELQKQIAQFDQNNAQAKSAIQESDLMRTKLAATEKRLNEAVTAREDAEKNLLSLKQGQEKAGSDSVQKISELQKNLESSTARIEKLEADIASAQDVNHKNEVEQKNQLAKIATLEQELAKKNGDLAQINEKLGKSDVQQNQLIAAQTGIAKAELEKKEHLEKIAQLEQDLAKKNGDLAQATQKLKENEEVQVKLAAAQAVISKNDAQDSAKLSQISSLEAVVTKKNEEIVQLQDRLAMVEKNANLSMESQRQAAADAKNAQSEQDRLLSSLKDDLAARSAELREAESRLYEANTKNADQQKNIASLTNQVAQAQKLANDYAAKAASVQPSYGTEAAPAQAAANQPIIKQPLTNQVDAAAPMPVPAIPAPTSSPQYPSADDYARLMGEAGIQLVNGVQDNSGASAASGRSAHQYNWKTQQLDGKLISYQVSNRSEFDREVRAYLDQSKKSCSGDFAAAPSDAQVSGVETAQAYEIACVQNNDTRSAALLFTYQNGIYSLISYEGKAEFMSLAMDARDKMTKLIR
ncbi:MAG: hypothetical protein JNK24_05500 [Alphaproteobacteria bacterium]|nr:hypothetical protein [Alphaproteobacteria bacterium]